MSKTRAIRLSATEDQKIDEFLKHNPFFDFSTLARMAILGFIKEPKLIIQPIGASSGKTSPKNVRRSTNGQSH